VCLGKLPMVRRTLFCRHCSFNIWVSARLVLNRLLLNREYVVINALKALASIISMCDLHVIFLSNITPILLQCRGQNGSLCHPCLHYLCTRHFAFHQNKEFPLIKKIANELDQNWPKSQILTTCIVSLCAMLYQRLFRYLGITLP
jgi:hypothetical protein